MEEISTYPNHQPSPSLSEAYDISKKIEEKLAEIDKLKEESGIVKLEHEVQALDEAYTFIIKHCVSNNIFEDGPIRLVSKGGMRRQIIPEAFHKAYPQMFFKLATIPVTASENSLAKYYEEVCGLSKKEAKSKAKDEITSICEVVGNPKYEVINLAEG